MNTEDGAAALRRMLIKRRAELGLSQMEIARRMGTTQSNVSELESGIDARLSTWIKWAGAVGLVLDVTLSVSIHYGSVEFGVRSRKAEHNGASVAQRT